MMKLHELLQNRVQKRNCRIDKHQSSEPGRLKWILLAILVPVFIVACGKQRRTAVKKITKPTVTNPNTKMSAETCSKKKPAMVLGLEGECIKKEECSSTLGMKIDGDHCRCEDDKIPSPMGNSCVEKDKTEEATTESVSATQRTKKVEKSSAKDKEPVKNGSVQADSEVTTNTGLTFSGSGLVNIQCGTQNLARVEKLDLVIKISSDENAPPLAPISWTMDTQDFFSPKESKELKASPSAPGMEALKLSAKCSLEDCGAFEFTFLGKLGEASVKQVFYGVPDQNCAGNDAANARIFKVSNSKPE